MAKLWRRSWKDGFSIFFVGCIFLGVLSQGFERNGRADETDEVRELSRVRQRTSEQMGALNGTNPLSGDFSVDGVVGLTGPLAQAQRLMSQPMVKRYLKTLQDPQVLKNLENLIQHPNRKALLYAEGAWFLILMIFQAWRVALAQHWFKKVLIKIGVTALYFFGSVGCIPWLVFGEPYLKFLDTLVQVLGF